jgi:hypothetical protein
MARQDNDDGEYDNDATLHYITFIQRTGMTIGLSGALLLESQSFCLAHHFVGCFTPLCYRSNGQLSAASTVRLTFHRCKIQDNPLPSIS